MEHISVDFVPLLVEQLANVEVIDLYICYMLTNFYKVQAKMKNSHTVKHIDTTNLIFLR